MNAGSWGSGSTALITIGPQVIFTGTYRTKERTVKVASILMYFMLKQLAHFLQNILADLLYKIRHRLIRKCYGYFSCP